MRKECGRILRAIFVPLVLALFLGACGSATDQELRMTAASEDGLTLDLSVPAWRTEEVALPEGVFQRLSVAGWAASGSPGAPELPVRGVLIQVPPSGKISIAAVEGPFTSFSGIHAAPVVTQTVSDEGVVQRQYKKNEILYAAKDFLPGPLAVVERIGIFRGAPVARVLFRPFQWNPATGELRVYTRITAKIAFEEPQREGSAASDEKPDEDAFAPLLGANIINYRPAVLGRAPAPRDAADALALFGKPKMLRIEVKKTGIYRITGGDLSKNRIYPGAINPETFRLMHRGEEVSLRMVMKGRRFAAGDYLEFYAQSVDNSYTDTNVYWLSWGGEAGRRMAVRDASPAGQIAPAESFAHKARFEENHIAWGLTPGAPDADYWFWERINAPSTKNYSFSLPSVSPAPGTGTARVCFQGRTTLGHHTRVLVNGTVIGNAYWNGDIAYVQEMNIDLALLREGVNTLAVQSPGDTGAVVDSIYLNWFEISYLSRFAANADELAFELAGAGRLRAEVGGFSRPAVYLYDITDPSAPVVYENYTVAAEAGGYKLTAEDDVAGRKMLYAASEDAVGSPSSLAVWTPSDLKNPSNRADYILIAPREFLSSLRALASYRQTRGLKVKSVAVEDIYNEFSFGLTDPAAIRDFLAWAYQNWSRPAPAYVLLVGDATYDYRDYLGAGKKSWVPAHLTFTNELGVTPDDNWYVAVEGDDVLPEMMIGRIPASSAAMAGRLAAKVLGYERSFFYKPKEALFAADNNELFFEAVSDGFISRLGAKVTPQKVYLRTYPDTAAARGALIGHINRGMIFTAYVGHGDATHWSGEPLFSLEDIALLGNAGKLTFLLTFDCLNGFFAIPTSYSIGEAFVTSEKTGAVAAFSPSGLGYTIEHQALGNAVLESIFTAGNRLAGDITTGSKIAAYGKGASADIVRTFTLFGDPATKLKVP
ncbi:MAG: hypothetical protein K4445_03860 [Deltaproteobacteria bacterium]|jgi:hypothetical protein